MSCFDTNLSFYALFEQDGIFYYNLKIIEGYLQQVSNFNEFKKLSSTFNFI